MVVALSGDNFFKKSKIKNFSLSYHIYIYIYIYIYISRVLSKSWPKIVTRGVNPSFLNTEPVF
jgi:hypothetical protein